MSYKVNDLRRLKKAELLEIIRNSPITLSSSKPTKQHLINCLLSAERSEDSASQHPRDAGTDALPVALNSDFLNYQALTDDFLVRIPNFSFQQIYTYCCGNDADSMKTLDRAVKHASAGDIGDIKLCQVDPTMCVVI